MTDIGRTDRRMPRKILYMFNISMIFLMQTTDKCLKRVYCFEPNSNKYSKAYRRVLRSKERLQ